MLYRFNLRDHLSYFSTNHWSLITSSKGKSITKTRFSIVKRVAYQIRKCPTIQICWFKDILYCIYTNSSTLNDSFILCEPSYDTISSSRENWHDLMWVHEVSREDYSRSFGRFKYCISIKKCKLSTFIIITQHQ